MNAITMIGHNRPPIDLEAALEPEALTAWIGDRLAVHTEFAAKLLAANKLFLLATAAGISNDNIDMKATTLGGQMLDAIKETEQERVKIKAPVLAAQRAIDGAAKTITDPLSSAVTEIERRSAVYKIERDRQLRQAAAEEAERLAAITANALDEAMTGDDPDAIERAATAETEQYTAEAIVYAPIADLTRTRTASGASSSLKDNWVYALADLSKVPAHLIMLNDAAVKAQIKATPKGTTPMIPGLTITNQPKVSIR